jgi:threonine dehydrogenase-like Zn-dependent dehydrogenase
VDPTDGLTGVRAFVVSRPGRYGVVELTDPRPGSGEVLIAPAAVGICGSDLELVAGRRPADFACYPIVPGHEWSGHVVELGPGVGGLEVGQPVVAQGVRACDRCDRCREGRSNLCAGAYAETGFTHPGALAQRLAVPVALVHALPADRDIESAALIEPAACVASGLLEVGMPAAGCRVAIVGDGPLGLLALLLLRLYSPTDLVMLGHRPDRVGYGEACGATAVLVGAEGTEPELRARFDLVIEATNSAPGAATALALARRGGTVLLLGISGSARPALDPDVISLGQLRVQGAFAAAPAAWRLVVALYAAGLLDPGPLITHRFDLAETPAALAVLSDRGVKALKVLIRPN